MGIDQTGDHGAAMEVDDFGARASGGFCVVVGANSDDASVPDGEGLGDGVIGIDGEDLAVDEDRVSGLGKRGGGQERDGEKGLQKLHGS